MVDLPRVRSIIWSTWLGSGIEGEVKDARRLRGRVKAWERVWEREVRCKGVLEVRLKELLRSREDARRRRRSKGEVQVVVVVVVVDNM